MKRIIITCLLIIFAVSIADAGRRRPQSGKVKDRVYIDSKYGFKITIDEGWKHSLRKENDNFRLLLTKRKYEIPAEYINAPDYTQIPRIIIWTDTTSLPTFAFLDSLVSKTWNTKQKKELLKEFEIIASDISSGSRREKFIPRGRKPVKLSGEQAILWQAKSTYVKDVAVTSSGLASKRVYGAYGGAIVVVKKGNRAFVFHLMTEWAYFENNLKETLNIISTFEFSGESDKEKADKSEG
ncbi:MAG: hypothetical protein IID63_01955 [candidate division Zixibacteria bacterium]|nr:hypothetical protein [candidate division Zixibacteria bacterium]